MTLKEKILKILMQLIIQFDIILILDLNFMKVSERYNTTIKEVTLKGYYNWYISDGMRDHFPLSLFQDFKKKCLELQ